MSKDRKRDRKRKKKLAEKTGDHRRELYAIFQDMIEQEAEDGTETD